MNDNFIICFFPKFAGGKFIGNCLALSKQFWQSYMALHVDNVDLM